MGDRTQRAGTATSIAMVGAIALATGAGAAPPRVTQTSLTQDAAGIWLVDQQGLDTVQILFSEAVTVPAGSVRVWTPEGGELEAFAVSLSPDQRTLTVDFTPTLFEELVTLVLEPTIASLAGEPLDGEIPDPSRPMLPSGDGTAGGAAVLRIRVLQGDANRDGEVDDLDAALILGQLGLCVGDEGFVPSADLNRDGCVNVLDVQIYSVGMGGSLPPLDGVSPVVSSVVPDPATPLSGPTSTIEVSFSSPIRAETVFPRALTVVRQNGQVVFPASASLLDASTVQFALPSPLAACGTYQLRLSNALSSAGGLLLSPPALSISGLQQPDPPLVTPPPGLVQGDSITLSGTAGPTAVHVRAVTGAGMSEGPVSNGSWSLTVPLRPNEINPIFVSVRTSCGVYSNAAMVQTTSDGAPPQVLILFPADGSLTTDSAVPVSGTVADLLSGAAKLQVEVNGVSASVDPGIGTNGTFEARMVPLALGDNELTATATDAAGNTSTHTVTVIRQELPRNVPNLERLSGDGQSATVGTRVSQPLMVRVLRGDGSPFAGKLVTFRVTRGDGALAASEGQSPPPGTLLAQVFTDGKGIARAWWTLGGNSGPATNRVEATALDVVGTATFAATAMPAPASRLVINDGDNQRGGTGGSLPLPLKVRVLDGVNPVGGVPVTFAVVAGGGSFDGESEVVVESGVDGIAQVAYTLGAEAGVNRISATFPGQADSSVRFTAVAIASQPGLPTAFEGRVTDIGGRPIVGALCSIKLNGTFRPSVFSDSDGRFRFEGLAAGAAEVYVNGSTATQVGDESVPTGSYPPIHYEDLVVVAGAANQLWKTVLLPRLEPENQRFYSTTEPVELTVAGIDGLKLTVLPGSMRLADGTPAPNGTPISVNQTAFDRTPMPFPDAIAPPFAATMQPACATFDPPVKFEFPNLEGLAPGTTTYITAWNETTARFDIVGSGRVSDDGSTIVSDPGSGISIAGWHGPWGSGPRPQVRILNCAGTAAWGAVKGVGNALLDLALGQDQLVNLWNALSSTYQVGGGLFELWSDARASWQAGTLTCEARLTLAELIGDGQSAIDAWSAFAATKVSQLSPTCIKLRRGRQVDSNREQGRRGEGGLRVDSGGALEL